MITTDHSQRLTEGFQLEQSVTLVQRTSFNPAPVADEILTVLCGERVRQIEHGEAIWRNEGPRHRLCIRSRYGFSSFVQANEVLAAHRGEAVELAKGVEARLLSTGMHPWMLPSQAQSWPHGKTPRDDAMHLIFGGGRHGFANNHPLRLSLPFETDDEFARLNAALRLLMPLMPALAASSPFAEGARGPAMSCRLGAQRDYYCRRLTFRQNLVPEALPSREAYEAEVTRPLNLALEARELRGPLQPLDVCAFGLRADFAAGLIHIEALDGQECLQADLAVCAAVIAMARICMRETHASHQEQSAWSSSRLGELLDRSIVDAGSAVLRDSDYLRILGFPEGNACRSGELWQYLIEEYVAKDEEFESFMPALGSLVSRGCLSSRLLAKLGRNWGEEQLFELYRGLADHLDSDSLL